MTFHWLTLFRTEITNLATHMTLLKKKSLPKLLTVVHHMTKTAWAPILRLRSTLRKKSSQSRSNWRKRIAALKNKHEDSSGSESSSDEEEDSNTTNTAGNTFGIRAGRTTSFFGVCILLVSMAEIFVWVCKDPCRKAYPFLPHQYSCHCTY